MPDNADLEEISNPVEPERGVLIHPGSDRRLAAEHWLLSTLPSSVHARARTEWESYGGTLLPLGGLFSAVRLPERVVHAVAGVRDWRPGAVDDFLSQALEGGPVICDPRFRRWFALVPASMARTWTDAAREWAELDIALLGRGMRIGVPPLTADSHKARTENGYWSVPMASAAELCTPLAVARLIAAACRVLGQDGES